MPDGRAARALQVIDPVLTEVARQFAPSGFVGSQVCPTIPVEAISSQYPIFDERYFFSAQDNNKISDRAETPEIELVWSLDSFVCEDYGLKISITPRERQQSSVRGGGAALRLERSKVKRLVTAMKVQKEIRIAAALRHTGNGGQLTSTSGATAAFLSSTAIETDFKTAKLAVYNLTGLTPNVAVIPYAKAYDMALNPTLRDIFKYQVNDTNFIRLGSDAEGEDIFLPRWFQGCRLLVPKGTLKQTGHEGSAKSFSDIWGTSVRFLYVDPNADWGVPSTMYQFSHPVLSGGGTADGDGFVVDRWNENDPVKELIRAMECVDEKCCAPDLGYELTGV